MNFFLALNYSVHCSNKVHYCNTNFLPSALLLQHSVLCSDAKDIFNFLAPPLLLLLLLATFSTLKRRERERQRQRQRQLRHGKRFRLWCVHREVRSTTKPIRPWASFEWTHLCRQRLVSPNIHSLSLLLVFSYTIYHSSLSSKNSKFSYLFSFAFNYWVFSNFFILKCVGAWKIMHSKIQSEIVFMNLNYWV